jgi:hypothetical protein
MELELGSRLNLLTGDNGLGKSFLLDIAWWVLSSWWPAEVNRKLAIGRMARPKGTGAPSIGFRLFGQSEEDVQSVTFSGLRQAWHTPTPPILVDTLVVYAQVDGSFAIWDPVRNYPKRLRGSEQDRPPAYVFTSAEVWNGLVGEEGPLCNGLIDDWAGWQKERGEAFERLVNVLAALSPDAHEQLRPGPLTRISLNDVRDIPTLTTLYGQDVPVLEASAGSRRIIALAYLLVWVWQEHVWACRIVGKAPVTRLTFLIDEVEAHLHPRWQRTILRALLTVVEALSSEVQVQLIAATHSPIVMASAEPWFDPAQDAWFDLDLVSNGTPSHVQIEKRPWVRRGDVSNWLTSQAFDFADARSLEAEEAVLQARRLLSRVAPITTETVQRADTALRAVLSDIDPFWVRWSAFTEPYLGVRA